jgi:hypothetical protein
MSWPDGAWQRISVTVDGAVPTEVSDVWWLVADGVFADLRVLRSPGATTLPYSSTQAFAGTCTLDPGTWEMRWHHLVDTEERVPDIVGRIEPDRRDARLMHETGDDFTELWARIDPEGTPTASRVEPGLVAVRVGNMTIVVTDDGGARYLRADDTWVATDVVGTEPALDGERRRALRSWWA